MQQPGPPRFAAVGDSVELAPRDPDPDVEYRWRIARAPPAATATCGDDPVERFEPDAPGRYVAELTTSTDVFEQTIRVFPGERRPNGDDEGGVSGDRGVTSTAPGSAASDAGVSGSRAPESGGSGGGRPRVQVRARVDGETVVVEADARPNPESDERAADLDVEFFLDDRDSLDDADVDVEGHDLRIPLSRLPDRARVHAVAVGDDGYSVADAVDLRRPGASSAEANAEPTTPGVDRTAPDPAVRATCPYHPPEWAVDAVIYEIYVRTFAADDEGRSTFDAIADRFDYLADLGVDVLWLTPVLQNDHAPHGYNITDFHAIASDLGTRADYEHFVERAHDHGMRVLFDLVLNHSARAHPFFRDALANPDGEYHDWYEWRAPGEPETYFEWKHIANFDFDSLAVRRYLLDVVDAWAPLVDGFRCDMAWAVPENFWTELHDRVKARDPEFLLLDETIPYIPDFQGGLFDMHFDSTTAFALREVGTGNEPADAVLDAVDQRAAVGFPDHASFMLYAENHDETRYVVECGEDAAMAAAGALATLPGAPMLYAGQELGQRGRRDALAWDHARPDLRAHYERLLDARHSLPALATDARLERVDYEVEDGDPDRVVAYARVADAEREADAAGDAAVVVLNFGAEPAAVSVAPAVGPEDVLAGASVPDEGGLRVDSVAVLPADAGAFPG